MRQKPVKPAKEKRKELIIDAIENNRFTKRQFATETGINKSTVETDLEELKKSNKIKHMGPKRGGKWKVLQS